MPSYPLNLDLCSKEKDLWAKFENFCDKRSQFHEDGQRVNLSHRNNSKGSFLPPINPKKFESSEKFDKYLADLQARRQEAQQSLARTKDEIAVNYETMKQSFSSRKSEIRERRESVEKQWKSFSANIRKSIREQERKLRTVRKQRKLSSTSRFAAGHQKSSKSKATPKSSHSNRRKSNFKPNISSRSSSRANSAEGTSSRNSASGRGSQLPDPSIKTQARSVSATRHEGARISHRRRRQSCSERSHNRPEHKRERCGEETRRTSRTHRDRKRPQNPQSASKFARRFRRSHSGTASKRAHRSLAAWSEFARAPPAVISVEAIPWPDVNSILTALKESDDSANELKTLMRTWHPDKFQQSFGKFINREDEPVIMRRIGKIFRKLMDARKDME
eukprot:25034_1